MDPNPDNDRPQPRLSQPASRRRDVRLTALHGVATVIVDFTGTVEAQDLSVGGVRVLTSSPLGRDRIYEFRISLGPTRVVRRGRAIHCRHVGPGQWSTGVCFTPESFAGSTIEELVDAILSAQLHVK